MTVKKKSKLKAVPEETKKEKTEFDLEIDKAREWVVKNFKDAQDGITDPVAKQNKASAMIVEHLAFLAARLTVIDKQIMHITNFLNNVAQKQNAAQVAQVPVAPPTKKVKKK